MQLKYQCHLFSWNHGISHVIYHHNKWYSNIIIKPGHQSCDILWRKGILYLCLNLFSDDFRVLSRALTSGQTLRTFDPRQHACILAAASCSLSWRMPSRLWRVPSLKSGPQYVCIYVFLCINKKHVSAENQDLCVVTTIWYSGGGPWSFKKNNFALYIIYVLRTHGTSYTWILVFHT